MVGEETTSFPEFCPTRGGHGVGGVRGGWYMNLGAQSLPNFEFFHMLSFEKSTNQKENALLILSDLTK